MAERDSALNVEKNKKGEKNMKKNALTEQLSSWLYDWVAENFGQSEADDPSYDLDELASMLYDHRYDIYHYVERKFQEEDCEAVAEEMGVELTQAQKDVIVDDFMESEQYESKPSYAWREIIQYELERKKEN